MNTHRILIEVRPDETQDEAMAEAASIRLSKRSSQRRRSAQPKGGISIPTRQSQCSRAKVSLDYAGG